MQKLIDYDMPTGGVQQASFGFYPDTPNESHRPYRNFMQGEGNTAQRVIHNPDSEPRKDLISESKRFEVRGPLSVDFFQSMRLLVTKADISLKVFFNEPKFFLHADTNDNDYKMVLEEAILYVRKVRVTPSIANSIDQKLNNEPALYPFIRREINSYNIPVGFSTFKQENIFRGQLANRYLIFLVDAGAANGDYEKNPFEFKHNGLTQVALFENGQNIAGDPIELDMTNNQTMNAYYQLLESIGSIGERAAYPPITYAEFLSHSTVFCFTRSPDLSHGEDEVVLPKRSGNVTLKLTFKENTTAALTCYIIGEFFAEVRLSGSGKEKAITTDFPV